LTKGHMELAKAKYADSLRADTGSSFVAGLAGTARRVFSFLRPLAILGPTTQKKPGSTLNGRGKDWNLTLLAVAYGFTAALAGSYNYIFQYVAGAFGWSFETLGYVISIVSVATAIFLALILPIAIKILKPKPLILELPVTPVETTPLLNSSSSTSSSSMPVTSRSSKTIKREIHSPLFDLNLARASLLFSIVSNAVMGLAQSPILFAFSGIFGAMGAGFSPAAQSVALALYAKRGGVETGRLFGAISLIEAISSQILAPFIYGFVFVKTVAICPRMVFFVSFAALSTSFCLLSIIRLPKDDEYHRQYLADLEQSESNEESSTSRAQEST